MQVQKGTKAVALFIDPTERDLQGQAEVLFYFCCYESAVSIPGITHITAIWIVTTAELPGDASNLSGRFKRNGTLCQAFPLDA